MLLWMSSPTGCRLWRSLTSSFRRNNQRPGALNNGLAWLRLASVEVRQRSRLGAPVVTQLVTRHANGLPVTILGPTCRSLWLGVVLRPILGLAVVPKAG